MSNFVINLTAGRKIFHCISKLLQPRPDFLVGGKLLLHDQQIPESNFVLETSYPD
jgi:hypothetical protein